MVKARLDVVHVPPFDLVVISRTSPHLGDGDVRAVGRTDQQGIRQLRRSRSEDILYGQLRHGGEVHPFPEGVHLQEDAQRELGVLGAVLQDLLAVVLPLVVHVARVHVELGFPQQLQGNRVQGLLLRTQLPAGGPPCVAYQSALDPPEALAAEFRLSAVPPPGQRILHAVRLRPLLDLPDVVVVDVVPGDDVGILFADQVRERLDDVLLRPVYGVAFADGTLLPNGGADAVDEFVLDAVLYVEGQHLESRIERVDVLEGIQLDGQVGQVSLVDRFAGHADARAHVHVVDVAVVVRDVGRQGLHAVVPELVPEVGDLPGALYRDLQRIDGATAVEQVLVLQGDNLGILRELLLQLLRDLDAVEVGFETADQDGDGPAVPGLAVQFDDRFIAVRRVRRADYPDVRGFHGITCWRRS